MNIRLKFAAATIAGLLISGPSIAAEIVPHQAMYRLTLQDMKVNGWAESSSGTMEVKVHRDCFHYGLDRHIDFKIKYTDGRETRLDIEERLREAVEGRQYWFWSRTTLNGKTVAIIAGDAERPKGGTLIEVMDETVEDAAKARAQPRKRSIRPRPRQRRQPRRRPRPLPNSRITDRSRCAFWAPRCHTWAIPVSCGYTCGIRPTWMPFAANWNN